MPYVDGFVLPVTQDRIADYAKIAAEAAKIWKEHGALEYWECVGDDLNTAGSHSFTDLAHAKDGDPKRPHLDGQHFGVGPDRQPGKIGRRPQRVFAQRVGDRCHGEVFGSGGVRLTKLALVSVFNDTHCCS